ncbi:MAG: hypothetical protein IKD76_04485 [Clostridia bacterium]|nr:hypothetical protein [Clostridia bacterium]
MNKLKYKIEKIDVIIVIVLLFLIIGNIAVFNKKIVAEKSNTVQSVKTYQAKDTKKKDTTLITVPVTEEETIKKLSTMGERDRMEYYCAKYFECIDNGEYESAYNMLYSDFKKNYFPTVEEYIAYIEKTYPSPFALSYDDITRQGDIYVLKISILDILGSRENKKEQRIVLKENTYNNFVISFQVI